MTISVDTLALLAAASSGVRTYTSSNGERTTVSVTMPGRCREDISLTTQDYGILIEAPEKRLDGLRLPPVDLPLYMAQRTAEGVSATMRDGLLVLTFPKPAPRTIAVG